MLHKKGMCVSTTILPLFQDNYPNCGPQGAPQVPQDKHPPLPRSPRHPPFHAPRSHPERSLGLVEEEKTDTCDADTCDVQLI